MKYFLLGLITIYQKTLSLDHGWLRGRHLFGYCRFYPSCSEYAFQAIDNFGILRGTYLATLRILSCNPLHPPAYKPLIKDPSQH